MEQETSGETIGGMDCMESGLIRAWISLQYDYLALAWSPVFIQTQRTQRNRLRCVRCVNENRKQRKRLFGCFDDWLFRSTIPIGWRLRALRLNGNRFYALFLLA